MAKEPNAPKGWVKPAPAVDAPTRVEEAPAASATQPLGAKGNAGAAEKAKVQGKIVRKDTPGSVAGETQAYSDNTIAADKPNAEAPHTENPVEKPSDSLEGAVVPAGAKGATILGDYKLLKKLGQGGMGAVYKAHCLKDDRIVAVKVLAKELSSKESYVLRFQREARAMQKADHPNVLRCLDVGHVKNYHFLVMEFVEGGSIEGWLKKQGRFSIGDALHIILKTAEGLQHAHEKSLIHRDIKPDNILLTTDGVVKIADLGLAKDTDEDTSLTKTGAGAGTPIYMAPEQARDVKHVDCRVDIYALGVMLYVFLTGQPPFQGTTLVELTTAKEKGKFDPMRRHNDDVPPKLDLILDKMLAKDAKSRYASCSEVIAQLEALGLANDTLSFIEEDAEKAPATSNNNKPTKTETPAGGKSTDVKEPAKQPGPSKPVSKTVAPGKGGDKTNIQDDDSQKDIWYWNLITPEGKKVTKKVTTEQLRMLIKSGHLDAEAEVSRTMKSGFRPAATYAEFQPFFRMRETQTTANVKGHKFKDKMKEITDEDARRRKYGWMSKMFKSVGGTLFGLLWIVLILGLVAAGGYFFYIYVIAGR